MLAYHPGSVFRRPKVWYACFKLHQCCTCLHLHNAIIWLRAAGGRRTRLPVRSTPSNVSAPQRDSLRLAKTLGSPAAAVNEEPARCLQAATTAHHRVYAHLLPQHLMQRQRQSSHCRRWSYNQHLMRRCDCLCYLVPACHTVPRCSGRPW